MLSVYLKVIRAQIGRGKTSKEKEELRKTFEGLCRQEDFLKQFRTVNDLFSSPHYGSSQP